MRSDKLEKCVNRDGVFWHKIEYNFVSIDILNNEMVTYEYDSWGKIQRIKDAYGNNVTSSTHIGKINPYRYRSYRYDEETGLYYLNSRYYNPEWGRFINADGIVFNLMD